MHGNTYREDIGMEWYNFCLTGHCTHKVFHRAFVLGLTLIDIDMQTCHFALKVATSLHTPGVEALLGDADVDKGLETDSRFGARGQEAADDELVQPLLWRQPVLGSHVRIPARSQISISSVWKLQTMALVCSSSHTHIAVQIDDMKYCILCKYMLECHP